MTDDRLHRWLEPVDQPLTPDSAFAAALLDELGAELGFASTASATVPAGRTRRARPTAWEPRTARRRWDLLLVAALHTAGSIRIAIRPDHPQVSLSDAPAVGFDRDVADALAAHLDVAAAVVIEDVGTMLEIDRTASWDAALPSVGIELVDPATFLATDPYYAWSRYVVVADGGPTTLEELATSPVCAVSGDAGTAWLRGNRLGARSPITTTVIERSTDEACFAALDSGDAVALVTAQLSDADLQVRAGVQVIGGPDPEPRPIVVRREQDGGPDPGSLLEALDGALTEMRADGTLTRLSQSRFGGADLTTP
jgi:ABC-type amino acid transport substrate-binding protein